MSVKTYTFRYDEDSDVGRWMATQNRKSDSLEQSIRMMIANFGYNDLPTELPKRVKLGAATEEKKEIVLDETPKKSKRQKQEEHQENNPDNPDSPGINMLSNL